MRPVHGARSLVVACFVLAACGSSSNNAVDAGKGGSDGGATGGSGGSAADGATGGTGGASDGGGQDVAPFDAGMFDVREPDSAMSMTLTSNMLTNGAVFMDVNTCAGANTSPQLRWMNAPAGAMSFAVTLTDLSIGAVHWVIWDIPANRTELPMALPGDTTLTSPVMAMQLHKADFFGAGGAYRGPCPMGANHTYQFQVNAIGTATLAGLPATPTTDDVRNAILAASLAHGDLFGTSSASAPPADAGGQ